MLEHAEILASRMTLEEVNQAKAAMSDGGHPYTLEERYLDLMKRCLARLAS